MRENSEESINENKKSEVVKNQAIATSRYNQRLIDRGPQKSTGRTPLWVKKNHDLCDECKKQKKINKGVKI